MRYPALTLLMAVHYLAAVLGGFAAYVLVSQQYGSFWAVAGAVTATLVMAAIGDAIRLASDIEAGIRDLRPKAQWTPPAEWSRPPPLQPAGEPAAEKQGAVESAVAGMLGTFAKK